MSLRMSIEQVVAIRARLDGVPAKKRTRKYRNERVIDADGIAHDSKKEERRYRELRLELRSGGIHALARQVAFALPGQTEYRADFVVGTVIDGMLVMRVEDVKSSTTRALQAYRIKVRQMRDIYRIEVVEV